MSWREADLSRGWLSCNWQGLTDGLDMEDEGEDLKDESKVTSKMLNGATMWLVESCSWVAKMKKGLGDV